MSKCDDGPGQNQLFFPFALLFQLTAVHLVDAHHCSDPTKFISVLLTSLSTMIHIELPHVNVLSKIDLVEQYGKLGVYCNSCTLSHCAVLYVAPLCMFNNVTVQSNLAKVYLNWAENVTLMCDVVCLLIFILYVYHYFYNI